MSLSREVNQRYVRTNAGTGRLVTAENQHLIPEKDLDEWDAAVREYEERHGSAGG